MNPLKALKSILLEFESSQALEVYCRYCNLLSNALALGVTREPVLRDFLTSHLRSAGCLKHTVTCARQLNCRSLSHLDLLVGCRGSLGRLALGSANGSHAGATTTIQVAYDTHYLVL